MRENAFCKRSWTLLNDYMDGRLRGRKRDRAEAHLGSCQRCRETLVELEGIRRLIAEAPAPEAPAGFWASWTPRAATPASRSWAARQLWRPLLAAGLVSLLTLLLLAAPRLRPTGLSPREEAAGGGRIPHSTYILQHAGFAASQPLSAASAYVLLSARAAEDEGDANSAEDQ